MAPKEPQHKRMPNIDSLGEYDDPPPVLELRGRAVTPVAMGYEPGPSPATSSEEGDETDYSQPRAGAGKSAPIEFPSSGDPAAVAEIRNAIDRASGAPAANHAPIRLSTEAPRGPAPIKLLRKLALIMQELDWVEKRGHNDHFHYDYATESDIMAAIRPRLAQNLIFVQTLVEKDERIKTGRQDKSGKDVTLCRVQLLHIFTDTESGETMDAIGVGFSLEADDDKAFYKAYTGAMKYSFAKLFLISTGDDPEKNTPEERAAKKSARDTKGTAAPNGGSSPQRQGGAPMFEEGTPFNYTGPVPAYEVGKTRDLKNRWVFKLPDGIKASTLVEKMANELIKERVSGVHFVWSIVRTGSFFNIQSVARAD